MDQDCEVSDSVTDLSLAFVYNELTINQIFHKFCVASAKYTESPQEIIRIYKNFYREAKMADALRTYLPMLNIFTPLSGLQTYAQYDQFFFETMNEFFVLVNKTCSILDSQRVIVLIGDHSELVSKKHLRNWAQATQDSPVNIKFRTIGGAGHQMFQIVIPFISQVIQAAFSDV